MGYKDRIKIKENAPDSTTTNGLTGADEGVGPYQFIRRYHEGEVKKQLGLSWDDFKKSKEAQEKYFEYFDENTLTPAVSKYREPLKKTFPAITDDQIKQMVHFGGAGNIDKALKDNSYFYKGIDKNGTSLASYSDLGKTVKAKEAANPTMNPNLLPLDKSKWMQPLTPIFNVKGTGTSTAQGAMNKIDVQQDKNLATVSSTPKRSLASNLLPFASNIANAFTKLPAPPVPVYGSPIALKRIDMSNERNDVERGTRSMDRFAEQQFDPQTGYQAKAFNNAQRFSQLSKVNQDERNINTGIANEEMKANLGVSMQNQNMQNSYNNSLFERKLAQQRFNQENLTNASDKYTAIQDRDAAERSVNYSTQLQMSRDTYGEFKKHQDMWNAEQEAQKKNVTTQRYGGKMRNGGIMSNYTAGAMHKMNFKRVN